MARIPVYEQQLVPNVSAGVARRGAGNVGAAVAGVGVALDRIVGAVDRREDVDFALERQRIETEGRMWAARAASQADLDMAEHLRALQESAQPGAPKFTPDYLKRFDEYSGGALKNAPSAFARQMLDAHMQASRERYGRAAMVYEAGERARYQGQMFDEGVQMSSKLLLADPSLFEREIGKWTGTAATADGSPEVKAKLREIARKNLAWYAVIGEIDRDPASWAKKKPADSAVAPPSAGVSEADARRLASFRLTPEQDARITEVAGRDEKKATFLRTVLAIENRGFGGVRSDARSAAGSLGPFQFIESTGRAYGLASEADRQDFGKSAAAAGRYYDDLAKRYDGHLLAMIAEYNGGTKAARAVLAGKEPPQKETRDYVAMARSLIEPPKVTMSEAEPDLPPERGRAWDFLNADEQLRALQYADRKQAEVRQNLATGLRVEIQNAEAMAASGVEPATAAIPREQFDLAFQDRATADREWARYTTARQTASAVVGMQGLNTNELVAVTQRVPAAGDPNFAVTSHAMGVQAQAAARIVQSRLADPVAHAIQTGDWKLQPLDMSDEAASRQELTRRAAALPGMAEKYGIAQMLSKPEAQQIALQLELLPADQRVARLESMRRSVGDDAVYASMLQSIRPDSPVTALVGNIAVAGATENARMIARGEDLLNPTKGGKKTDGKGAAFPLPKETLLRQAWVDTVGEAYRGYPDAEATAYQAFKAYYAAAAADRGLNDPAASPDDAIVRRGIVAATGGIARWRTDWFGNDTPSARVVLPYGMPEDQFRDRVTSEWLRVREDAGYTKTDIGDIGLYNTGANGEYMVMSGKSWLPGKDGRPIILRITGAR